MKTILRSRVAWGVAMPFYIWLGDRHGIERMDIWAPPICASPLRRCVWRLALDILAR